MTDKMTAEQALEEFIAAATSQFYCANDEESEKWAEVIRQALTAPRVQEGWLATSEQIPEHGLPVIGFNPDWIDEDFNAHGIRECFVNGNGADWISAQWYDEQDCYVTEAGKAPTHWMPYPIVGDVTAAPAPVDSEFFEIPNSLRRMSNFEEHGPQVISELRAKLAAAEARVRELESALIEVAHSTAVSMPDELRVHIDWLISTERLRGGSDE